MTLSLVPPVWKEAPFIRLLAPFLCGIALHQYARIKPNLILVLMGITSIFFLLFQFNRLFIRFKFGWITGIFINLLLLCSGYLVCHSSNESTHKNSIVHVYQPSQPIRITLLEPLTEKTKSFKAIAAIDLLLGKDSIIESRGKVILYFAKDSSHPELGYGSSLVTSKPLSRIQNPGNPGGFDYKLYCERQGIFYSLFLTASDYRLLPKAEKDFLNEFLFKSRERIIGILSTYIPGIRESGLAKALLIGYKDELDDRLVSAYSNTGVVHIIAISGLHLGIIFWILNFLAKPLQKKLRSKLISAILILSGLWLFTLLAGAGPSVLRSAFMFSTIVLGNSISKNSNVLNNLAFSAFALLCYNPYWLWDAGFQLSYAAVLSIVLFYKPIYDWFYYRNKIADFAWKLTSVTLSAQILTLPIAVYHFHQLPVYFLLSNLVAVPLSGLILLGEILLCCLSFLPWAASLVGHALQKMIQYMNTYIENIDRLPFAVWDQLQISFLQLVMLYIIIAGMATWLMQKRKIGIMIGLFAILGFVCIRYYYFHLARHQLKVIVYNVSNAQAIDFVNGRSVYFVGDSALLNNSYFLNAQLKPSRTIDRVRESSANDVLIQSKNLFNLGGKNILIADRSVSAIKENFAVDVLIMSKNTRAPLASMINRYSPGLVVADGSNSNRQLRSWEIICELHKIPFHNVRASGAFTLNLR